MYTKGASFWRGARDTLPLVIGGMPFGIIFGTLAVSNGMSVASAIAMSMLVFAGSSQFIAIGLLAAGTSTPVILLTTFVVNLRHFLYAATLAPHMAKMAAWKKAAAAFILTDEAFAIVAGKLRDESKDSWLEEKELSDYYFGSALLMYVSWQIDTTLGAVFGDIFPAAATWGLDFAMPVAFIGILGPYLKKLPMAVAALVAGTVSILAYNFPSKLGLLTAAFLGIATGALFEIPKARAGISKKHADNSHE